MDSDTLEDRLLLNIISFSVSSLYQFKSFFEMVSLDVHDDTDEELLVLESAMGSEKKNLL
jgi:hypothetical protein